MEGVGALRGLFCKSMNPTQEGSGLTTYSPPKGPCNTVILKVSVSSYDWGGTQQSGRSSGYHQTPRIYHVWHRILSSGLKTHVPEAGGKEGGV